MGILLSLSKSWTIAWLALSEWALLVFGIDFPFSMEGLFIGIESFRPSPLAEKATRGFAVIGLTPHWLDVGRINAQIKANDTNLLNPAIISNSIAKIS